MAEAIALGEQALREPTTDDGLRSSIHSQLTMSRLIIGDLSGARVDAEKALAHARAGESPTQLAGAFAVLGLTDAAAGHPPDDGFWQEGLAADAADGVAALPYSPALVYGIQLMWRDRLDEAREHMQAALARAVAHGQEMPTSIAHAHLTELEVRAGQWDRAQHHLRAAGAAARPAGLRADPGRDPVRHRTDRIAPRGREAHPAPPRSAGSSSPSRPATRSS